MVYSSVGGLVTVTYGPLYLTECLSKSDSAVKVEELSDSIITKELMSGDVVRIQAGALSKAYRVTISVVPSHPVAMALRKQFKAEMLLTKVKLPMVVSDVGTAEMLSGLGYIEKAPTREWGTAPGEQQWIFILSSTV